MGAGRWGVSGCASDSRGAGTETGAGCWDIKGGTRSAGNREVKYWLCRNKILVCSAAPRGMWAQASASCGNWSLIITGYGAEGWQWCWAVASSSWALVQPWSIIQGGRGTETSSGAFVVRDRLLIPQAHRHCSSSCKKKKEMQWDSNFSGACSKSEAYVRWSPRVLGISPQRWLGFAISFPHKFIESPHPTWIPGVLWNPTLSFINWCVGGKLSNSFKMIS